MTACVAEVKRGVWGRENESLERRSGEWDREGARLVLVAGVHSPFFLAFFLTYLIHVYAYNAGYTSVIIILGR